MYKLKLALILIVVGGLIAYIGDRIGMKVGKKRLSLFGLRPKYTSTLITILTGILIALLSLGGLVITSQNFRQALLNMQRVLERLDNLTQQVEAKKAAKLELETKIDQLISHKKKLKHQLENLAHNLGFFGRGYLQTLTKEVIYHHGQILTTAVVADSKPVNKKLKTLINEFTPAEQVTGVTYNQGELQQAAAFINQHDGGIVRLLAAQNVFAGDKLAVSFDLYSNYEVFAPGTRILSLAVSKSQQSDVEKIINKLAAKLNKKGMKAGMLPDNQGRVISVKVVKFNYLVDQLQRFKGEKRIIVTAKSVIDRDDHLENKIKFRVEGLQ